jgi:hypothetical protein
LSRISPAARSIALAAGLVFLSLPAWAQPPAPPVFTIRPSNVLAISSPDNHCAVESHPKAIDPAVVECHAAFAPVPVIPPLLKDTTPEQRDAAGKWLVSQLDQPGVCGKNEKIDFRKSCASLIYVLGRNGRKTGIPTTAAAPWVYVVNIYRISHPKDENGVMLFTINSNGSEGRFGSGKDPVWELLAEQRVSKRCVEANTKFLGTSVSSSGLKPDACRWLSGDDLRYYPMLLLPHSNAKVVLNQSLVDSVFDAPIYLVQNVEAAMRQFTGANAMLKGGAPGP